jgi:hypothetical protein
MRDSTEKTEIRKYDEIVKKRYFTFTPNNF